MKVLLVNSLYYPNIVGGAERSTQILAEGLAQAGVETFIVTTADKDQIGDVNGIKVYYVKVFNLYWIRDAKKVSSLKKPFWHLIDSDNPFTTSHLRSIINREKPDIVHTGNLSGFSPSVWKTATQNRIPLVHTIRDMYLGCVRSAMFHRGRQCTSQCFTCRLYSIPKRRLSRSVDAVVGISEYVLKWHLAHGYFPAASVKRCIHNPITTNSRRTDNHALHRPLTLGFVGSVAPHKGVEILLATVAGMRNIDIRLKVFGKPLHDAYYHHLQEKYADPRIEFCGYAPVETIFPSIDVNVVPSLCNEAFGRVVPEGYSYGIPAIVSNRGGLPETVIDGATGYVFDPNRAGDLGEKLSRFISNPDSLGRMRESCFKRAEQYSVHHIIPEYIDLYKRLLA